MKKHYLKKRWTSLFVMLILGYSGQAQTFIDVNATGANDGSTWADAFTDLQDGIDATAAGDSVFVAKGLYIAPPLNSFVMKEGVKIYGSFQGTENYLNQRVFGTNVGDTSVLEGEDDAVLYCLNLTNASILDGFKLIGGQGGIYNDNSNPLLSNLTITMNQGDGISNELSSPIITNVIIAGNADNGILNFDSSPLLTNVTITGNGESGIRNESNSAPVLTNVTISGNMMAGISNVSSTTNIFNSIILGNTTGIENDGASSTNSKYSLIQDSISTMNGNLNATSILPTNVFMSAITPAMNTAGDFSSKVCSPTVDAGSNAFVPAAVTTDLAGNARIFNTTVDMGAFELDFIPTAITSIVDTTDCGSLVYNGVTYNLSGTHTLVLMAANGCDSTVTLNVTVNQPTTSITNHTECAGGTYTWNGTPYTTGGTYTFLTTNAVGCDSTATLNLLFGTPSTSTISKTTCSSYLWNGITRSSSGTYTFLTTNTAGCDSIATLNLTIGTPFTATVNQVSTTELKAVAPGTNLTYRWVDCDLDAYLPRDTLETFNVPRNGSYAVEVSDGICKSISACVNMTQAGINQNEDLNLGIQVYPNPTNGIVTISMPDVNEATVRLYDGSGKLVKTVSNIHSEDTISLEEFSTGVYTLQIQTQSGIKMERLMKN